MNETSAIKTTTIMPIVSICFVNFRCIYVYIFYENLFFSHQKMKSRKIGFLPAKSYNSKFWYSVRCLVVSIVERTVIFGVDFSFTLSCFISKFKQEPFSIWSILYNSITWFLSFLEELEQKPHWIVCAWIYWKLTVKFLKCAFNKLIMKCIVYLKSKQILVILMANRLCSVCVVN